MHVKGFAHAGSSSKGIMTAAGQVVQAIFQHVHPCRGYTYKDSPRIKNFLQETTLHQRAGKRFRVDYRGSKQGPLGMPFEKYLQIMVLAEVGDCQDSQTKQLKLLIP
jgi:hypothetical protein